MSETKLTNKLIEEVKSKMLFTMPENLDLWHWTNIYRYSQIKKNIECGYDFTDYKIGATGRGLYASTSAIDLMNKGDNIIFFKLKKGSSILVPDPAIFCVGIEEFHEMSLSKLDLPTYKFDDYSDELKKHFRSNPTVEKIEELMVAINPDACFYSFALKMSVMIRYNKAIIWDKTIDAEETVVEYYKHNPNEMLMFTQGHLERFLATKGITYEKPKNPFAMMEELDFFEKSKGV